MILRRDRITPGSLVVDASDNKRGKVPARVFKAHALKEKTSGGDMHGHTMVLWLLVTPRITLPAAFSFSMPDPALTAWHTENKRLNKQGVPPKHRPPQPPKNPEYPTKQETARALREACRRDHPAMAIKMVLTEALSATAQFMDQASSFFGGTHVIRQWRKTQHVRFRGPLISLEPYFSQSPGVPHTIKIRGEEEVRVRVNSARLDVDAHHTTRVVLALAYEHASESRSLVASDLSWRTLDIVQGYPLRWLVEVFLEEWTVHEGWGQLTKPPDEEGSSRSLVLSLLLEHCLLLPPQQRARLANNRPACTVGSLRERTRVACLLEFIREVILQDNPQEKLDRLSRVVEEVFQRHPSKKHMNHRDLGRLAPTPALQDWAERAYACA